MYMQLAGIVANPNSVMMSKGWVLWVFNIPLLVGIALPFTLAQQEEKRGS